MQQLLELWQRLDPRKRAIVIGATIAVFVSVLALSRLTTRTDLALLYSGLEAQASGDVVGALESRGAIYEVRGSAIYVESSLRDELRMTLASEGLPGNGTRGYEILDGLSGFGTTSQMFDSAYWRAKEGELARTIGGTAAITAARVHIAGVDSSPFNRNLRPTASVSLTANGAISAAQARAIRHLVAGAVAGMQPEDVAVIDNKGVLVGAENDPATPDDRSSALRERVQRLLEARVGMGNAMVELSIDTVTDTEMIRERHFDPASRVAISTDTEETTGSEKGNNAGVTVASNLPENQNEGGNASTSQNAQTRERINYEVSETQREISRGPGAVRRITVAVLVNGLRQTDANGVESLIERPAEELDALKELVSSAVGFDEGRGDVITIKSMGFQPIEIPPESGLPGLLDTLHFDVMSWLKIGVLSVVALILGLFVIRPIFTTPPPAPRVALPPGRLTENQSAGAALTGEIDDGDIDLPSLQTVGNAAALPANAIRPAPSQDAQIARLRGAINGREQETVDVLRSWLEEREELA